MVIAPTLFESNMLNQEKKEEEILKEEEDSKEENNTSKEEGETLRKEEGLSVDSSSKDLSDHEEKVEESLLTYWKNHLTR